MVKMTKMQTPKKLTKEQIAKIQNYSNEIETKESFVEAVRENPGYHIGYKGNKGFMNMIREILQNAIDEALREYSPCDRIWLFYDEVNHVVSVTDNGRGIPHADIVRIFTSEFTSSNYNKEAGDFTSGLHGVGSKVVVALSDKFEVESYVLGKAVRVTFVDGIPSEPEEIPCEDRQGTMVTFHISYDVMGAVSLKATDIENFISHILPIMKIGVPIHFSARLANGSLVERTFINEDGIITNLIYKTTKPLVPPICMAALSTDMRMKADIAFTYDSDDLGTEDITLFGNFCPTVNGTHLEGFLDGMGKWFRAYMNNIYLKSNSKLSIGISDIKTGLKAIVSVSHIKPVFTGQAKEMLSNEEIKDFVSALIVSSLDEWAKVNPQDLQKVCKYLKDIAEIRVKSEEGKVKLSKSYTSSALSGLPAKYIAPSGKVNTEFIIVEGDSALGSSRNSRCTKRQGLFPIRGKIPNALTTDKAKFLSNEEIAGMITIIGGGYGKAFDVSKVKFDKIISMADADPDGSHIHTLLLLFVLIYMRPLITHGLFYKAVPPLYGMTKGKNSTYFTNRLDLVLYVQKLFSKNNEILDRKGRKLTNGEVSDLLYRNIDYLYEIDFISRKYAVEHGLLELLLMNRDLPFASLKKLVESNYRFLKVNKVNNTPVIEGLLGDKINTIFLNDQFISDSHEIVRHMDGINAGNLIYKVNGQDTTLLNIMKLFENATPKNLTRYKGLGEMDPKQLGESTLHPDSARTLIQYTTESAEAEIEAIRSINSNKMALMTNLEITRHDIY